MTSTGQPTTTGAAAGMPRRDLILLLWLTAFGLLVVVMREASRLLATFEHDDQLAYGIDVLTQPQLPLGNEDVTRALQLWASFAPLSGRLITAHAFADLFFTLLVFFALRLALRRVEGGHGWLYRYLPSAYLVFDESENVTTLYIAGRLRKSLAVSEGWINTLVTLTALKWLAFGLALACILLLFALDRARASSTSVPPAPSEDPQVLEDSATEPDEVQAWWRRTASAVTWVARNLPVVAVRILRLRPEWRLGRPTATGIDRVVSVTVIATLAGLAIWSFDVEWRWPAIAFLVISWLVLVVIWHDAQVESLSGAAVDGGTPVLTVGRALWRLRVQCTVVLLFALLVAVPGEGPLDQLPDILRAQSEEWRNDRWSAVVRLGPLGVFCAAIWASGRLLFHDVSQRTSGSALVYSMSLLIACAVGGFLFFQGHASAAVWAPVAVLASLALLNEVTRLLVAHGDLRLSSQRSNVIRLDNPGRMLLHRVLVLLTVAPVAIAGIGMVRAQAGPWLLPESSRPALWWMLAGAAAALLGACGAASLLHRFDPAHDQRGPSSLVPLLRWEIGLVAAAAAAVTAIAAVASPATLADDLHVNDVYLLWLTLLTVVGGALAWGAERWKPMPFADSLGMRRTPFFVLMMAVFLLAGQLDDEVAYHRAHIVDDPVTRDDTLGDLFSTWAAAMEECRDAATTPLVMVAAPGGGIRAAYWTTLGLEELRNADTGCNGGSIFMASGVSGGSVGLTTWTLEPSRGLDRVKMLSGEKPLTANVAAMLYRDLPRSFLGLTRPFPDRAAVFERAWVEATKIEGSERSLDTDFYADDGLRQMADDEGDIAWKPLLMLNGMDVATGCRVVMSHIGGLTANAERACTAPAHSRTGGPAVLPGAHDAAHWLRFGCEEDRTGTLSAATAAHLSARFPVVSPTGALRSCAGSEDRHLYVGDGGYLENSGLQALSQVWTALDPHVRRWNAKHAKRPVVPYVVLFENDVERFAATAPPDRVRELSDISKGMERGEPLPQSVLREQLARSLQRSDGPHDRRGKLIVVSPQSKPDVSAPLGWVLSAASRNALEEQMKRRRSTLHVLDEAMRVRDPLPEALDSD